MPNESAADILAAIYDALTADPSLIPDTLKAVKLGIDADHSAGFPFCRIYLVDFSSPVADTISYERTFTFAVEIWQEYSQASKENAELNLLNAVEGVLNRLNGRWSLGDTVELSDIPTSPVATKEANGAVYRAATIRLVVTTLVQNPE